MAHSLCSSVLCCFPYCLLSHHQPVFSVNRVSGHRHSSSNLMFGAAVTCHFLSSFFRTFQFMHFLTLLWPDFKPCYNLYRPHFEAWKSLHSIISQSGFYFNDPVSFIWHQIYFFSTFFLHSYTRWKYSSNFQNIFRHGFCFFAHLLCINIWLY